MLFIIAKTFAFSASHVLFGLPEDHPCARLHGHNYEVTVEMVSASLDAFGFVCDYRSLDPLKKWIDETLDHRHLNDVLGKDNTTAERIARAIHEEARYRGFTLSAVTVKETPSTQATYRP